MAKVIPLHPVQANVLRELLFVRESKFSLLNKLGLPNDHFTFHIQKLVADELIEKTVNGSYTLTIKGKEFANRLDTDTKQLERQAKVTTLIVGIKKDKGEIKYLIQKRLKQPYFGYHGFLGGKIRWGETTEETAKR